MEQKTINVPSMKGIETKEKFVDTGRIVPIQVFNSLYPKENLHVDCHDVVVYAGGNYIQMLKTKGFLFDNHVYVKLDLAEDILWESISLKIVTSIKHINYIRTHQIKSNEARHF